MEFGKSFISGLGASTASAGMGFAGNALSQILGLSWSPQKAMEEQWKYNKNIMALQNEYQQQAAAQSQQYAKDYWDYTNTENQVKHLKNSGLNIGLIYGQSGAGGMGASGGAHQSSPEQPQGNPIGMALQVQQLQQQQRMNDAQIALTEAQADKTKTETNKIAGVDTQKELKQIQEIDQKINLMVKEGNYKDALTQLTKAKEETEKVLKTLRESEETLTRANVSVAFATATKYSEEAKLLFWEKENEKINNQYLRETIDDRVKAAYYNNCVAIALAAKYEKDVEVGDAQILQLQAAAKELNERADKEKWDKETYRKQVEGMIERWEDQTFNERIGLGLEFGENIINMLLKLRRKTTKTKTVSKKKGNTISTESYTESY
mgnify:CR=1 FL=1